MEVAKGKLSNDRPCAEFMAAILPKLETVPLFALSVLIGACSPIGKGKVSL
jgi:hypothetical protein